MLPRWLKNVILCVHGFEADEYKKKHKNIMVLPDDTKGNMAKVRNYILDNCDSEVCVMLDDDVKSVGCYENGVRIELSEGDLFYKTLEWYYQAIELNTVLFGINLQLDPKFYREFNPVCFLSPILGTFSCIIKKDNDIRYDERLGLNEDYDYFLQVIEKYHKVLRWNKYHYVADHISKKGGCGAYRVLDEEKRQAATMVEKWGNKVVRYNFNKSTNPKINVPLKGV